jgi:hypothetical protein
LDWQSRLMVSSAGPSRWHQRDSGNLLSTPLSIKIKWCLNVCIDLSSWLHLWLPEGTIEEEKYVVTDRFLSYGLHMTTSKSNCLFCVSRVSRVLLKTGGEQKLVVWSWSDTRAIA